jgi:hypothetical protein
MKTVISNAFSSTQSDSSITASVSASWGILAHVGQPPYCRSERV